MVDKHVQLVLDHANPSGIGGVFLIAAATTDARSAVDAAVDWRPLRSLQRGVAAGRFRPIPWSSLFPAATNPSTTN